MTTSKVAALALSLVVAALSLLFVGEWYLATLAVVGVYAVALGWANRGLPAYNEGWW